MGNVGAVNGFLAQVAKLKVPYLWRGVQMNRIAGLFVKLCDEPEGRVNPDGSFSKKLTARDEKVMARGVGIAREVLARAGEQFFYEVMSNLNRVAAEGLGDFGAHACTDITGFGLLGHALEMARASNVTLRFDAAALPLLPDAAELAGRGFLTGGGMSNREYVKEDLAFEGAMPGGFEMILVDPQTSGGLLVALAPDAARRYVETLGRRGVRDAAIVGEAIPPGDKRLVVAAPR